MSIGLSKSEGGVCVHVPMTLKRRSGRKEVIVPDGLVHSVDTGPDYHEALVIAISRAHRWKKLLDEGRYDSIIEMAQALKMNRYQMARMLRLTLLAPGIIEAILNGNEPDGFSLRQLVSEIPVLWSEQIGRYEFAAKTRAEHSVVAPLLDHRIQRKPAGKRENAEKCAPPGQTSTTGTSSDNTAEIPDLRS